MSVDIAAYRAIRDELSERAVTLVAVSKTKPVEDIRALYDEGHRDFGENYVQELVSKQMSLPSDIRWHFIGHLQRNKVSQIAPFVHLIHGVDSPRLLEAIDRQAGKSGRRMDVLLQVHIAREESKFGMDESELEQLTSGVPDARSPGNVRIRGLMGMASFSEDAERVRGEFRRLKGLFDRLRGGAFSGAGDFDILSMGMSGDYPIAVSEGSTMVRIGSLLFGKR